MKRKAILILTLTFLVSMLALTLTACGSFYYGYPSSNSHSHSFVLRNVSEEYKLSDATCENRAVYYYSCDCGEKGERTFEYGEALGHVLGEFVFDDNATCDKNATESATCTRENCTHVEIREVEDTKLGHDYSSEFTSLGDGTHGKVCSRDSSHVSEIAECSGGTATTTSKAVCSVCSEEYGELLVENLSYSLSEDSTYYIVTGIGNFSGTDLVIPATYDDGTNGELPVKEIAFKAFAYNAILTSVVIGDNVITIGEGAFLDGTSIETIAIGNSVTTIMVNAFNGCTSLTNVVIPDSVETIWTSAFHGCTNLKTVVLGATTNIFDGVFYECPSLTTAYYKGSAEDWNNIMILEDNVQLTNVLHFYSETEPALNSDGTAYDGKYWRYVDGEPTAWVKE